MKIALAFALIAGINLSASGQSWQAKATQKYPALATKDSAFNKLFLNEVNKRRESNPSFFEDSKWPLILADELSKSPELQDEVMREKKIEELTLKVIRLRDLGNETDVRIIQILSDGILGAPDFSGAPDICFVEGIGLGLADGEYWRGKLWPAGTKSYTDVRGAQRNVRMYVTSWEASARNVNVPEAIIKGAKASTPAPKPTVKAKPMPWVPKGTALDQPPK